jgi:hypothetical protein
VRASTPNVEFWLTTLFAWRVPSPVKNEPPVPTTNWVIPRLTSSCEALFCGLNRS